MSDEAPVPGGWAVRRAHPHDAQTVAALLHDFNTEFGTPTPDPAVLERRLGELLVGEQTFAVVAGDPIVGIGIGIVTLRPNVWFDGPVALLDELYVVPRLRGKGIGAALVALVEAICRELRVELVEINVDGADLDARRFYERHGYACTSPDEPLPALYYSRLLSD